MLHPATNGVVERWHQSLKTAIMCHGTDKWVDILPTVLLGLRTSYKQESNCSVAEMLYGTTLRLSGEFFVEEDMTSDLQIFVEKFREDMRKVRAIPTNHHMKRSSFIFKRSL